MASVGLVSTGRTRDALANADLLVASLSELSPAVLRGVIRAVPSHGLRKATPMLTLPYSIPGTSVVP